jgi:ABC-type glutathione transport system ATPase component
MDSGCTHYNTSHVAPQALSQNTEEMNNNGDNNQRQEKQHDLELGLSTTITDDDELQHTNESETEAEVDGSLGLHDHLPSTREKFIPVALAFKNLFFSIKVCKGKNLFQKAQKKTLLKDVHSELQPGEVTAIMGPSGFVPLSPSSVFHSLFDPVFPLFDFGFIEEDWCAQGVFAVAHSQTSCL